MSEDKSNSERQQGGHAVRRYPLALSTTALAMAWARQENGPHGSLVVAEREVSPLGRIGRLWPVPAESSLCCSVVVRPALTAEEGDAVWLLGGLIALRAVEAVTDHGVTIWWPERIVDAETLEEVAMVKADVQLKPGQVASAVVTMRFDLTRLGLDATQRDLLIDAVLAAVDTLPPDDASGGGLAAAYEGRCGLVGRRLKAILLPRGETRGTAKGVDRHGRLQVASATGMVEPVAVDGLRALEIVP